MFRLGIVVLILSVVLVTMAGRLAGALIPIDMPLSIASKQHVSRTFIADHNTTYYVQVDLKRKLPFETVDQVAKNLSAGNSIASNPVGATASTPIIVYSVLCNGREILRSSRGLYWGETIGATVGKFQGQRGLRYTVQATVLTPDPSLLPTYRLRAILENTGRHFCVK